MNILSWYYRFFLLIVCCGFCISSSACKQTKEETLTAVIVGSEEDANWGEALLNYYNDPSAKKETEVTFDQSIYTGTYKHTQNELNATYAVHKYTFNTDEYKGGFYVRSDTGELTGLYRMGHEDAGGKTVEECQKIADRMAGKLIDTDDYILSVTNLGDRGGYSYQYTKYIYEIPTNETLILSVYADGTVWQMSTCMLNQFPDTVKAAQDKSLLDRIQLLSSDSAKNKILEKVNAVYGNSVNIQIGKAKLVLTRDQKYAFMYEVSIGDEYEHQTFLVY